MMPRFQGAEIVMRGLELPLGVVCFPVDHLALTVWWHGRCVSDDREVIDLNVAASAWI